VKKQRSRHGKEEDRKDSSEKEIHFGFVTLTRIGFEAKIMVKENLEGLADGL
jgi:hypothetical protein